MHVDTEHGGLPRAPSHGCIRLQRTLPTAGFPPVSKEQAPCWKGLDTPVAEEEALTPAVWTQAGGAALLGPVPCLPRLLPLQTARVLMLSPCTLRTDVLVRAPPYPRPEGAGTPVRHACQAHSSPPCGADPQPAFGPHPVRAEGIEGALGLLVSSRSEVPPDQWQWSSLRRIQTTHRPPTAYRAAC